MFSKIKFVFIPLDWKQATNPPWEKNSPSRVLDSLDFILVPWNFPLFFFILTNFPREALEVNGLKADLLFEKWYQNQVRPAFT